MFHPSRNFEADCRKQPVCKLGFPQADPAGTAVPLQKSCSIAHTACDETYHCFRYSVNLSACSISSEKYDEGLSTQAFLRRMEASRKSSTSVQPKFSKSCCTSNVVESCLVVLSKTSPLTAVPCFIKSLDKQIVTISEKHQPISNVEASLVHLDQ